MARASDKSEKLGRTTVLLDRYLAHKGLRRTRQRGIVLEAFLNADAHVTVDELCDSIRSSHPEIGPATVYRCMNLFVEAGVAVESRFNEGRGRFEPAVEVKHHDHLICEACGDIQEFEDPRIERLQEEIALSRGFKVNQHRMELYGVCPKCLKAGYGHTHGGEPES